MVLVIILFCFQSKSAYFCGRTACYHTSKKNTVSEPLTDTTVLVLRLGGYFQDTNVARSCLAERSI